MCESMCTCVCLHVNKPSMLLGWRNLFILVDSWFGKLLPSAHFYFFFYLFSTFSPGGVRSDKAVGLRGPVSVIQ